MDRKVCSNIQSLLRGERVVLFFQYKPKTMGGNKTFVSQKYL